MQLKQSRAQSRVGLYRTAEGFTLGSVEYAKVFLIAALLGCAQTSVGPHNDAPQALSGARLSYVQLLVAAQDALDRGHADAAITLAADACRLDAERYEAYVIRGQALAQNDHVGESSLAFERARALGDRDAELFMALASNYDVERRYPEAVAVYLDYLKDHPHDAAMRDELALSYLLLGEPAQAVAQLQVALRHAPNNLQIHQDLGYALLIDKQFGQAEAHLAQVCQSAQAPPEARRMWAQALAGQHKYSQALAVVEALLEHYPLDRGAQILRGQLQAQRTPQTAPTDAQAADETTHP